jgi:hypothetical protein
MTVEPSEPMVAVTLTATRGSGTPLKVTPVNARATDEKLLTRVCRKIWFWTRLAPVALASALTTNPEGTSVASAPAAATCPRLSSVRARPTRAMFNVVASLALVARGHRRVEPELGLVPELGLGHLGPRLIAAEHMPSPSSRML